MKTFTEYLTESQKRYDFKIKIAGEMTNEQETALKSGLEKFVTNLSRVDFKAVSCSLVISPAILILKS